jgi:hypothetical protein
MEKGLLAIRPQPFQLIALVVQEVAWSTGGDQ